MKSARRTAAARAAFAIVLGVATLEVALRVVAALGSGRFASALREWDPERTLELRGEHCFRAWPGSVLRFANGTVAHENEMGFRGPVVGTPKPPGTYRVVILGGSTTHGYLADDDQTIDAHLRRSLLVPRASRVEVVNLGFDTYDAPCDQDRLARDGLALEPDAVILHGGINDVAALRFPDLPLNDLRRGARAYRRISEEQRRRDTGLWSSVKHSLFTARLPGVVRNLVTPWEMLPGPPEPDPRALDAYARMIEDTIALLPAATPVLLSMPPSLLDSPGLPIVCPGVVDVATTRRYRRRIEERLQRIADDARARGRDVRHVPHALPDEVFLDDCHLDGAGNRLLAEDFARALTSHDTQREP